VTTSAEDPHVLSARERNSDGGADPEPSPYKGEIHEYDGIIEHDNRLPRWWLYTLYGTIVFSVGYWFHYHTFGSGENPGAAYDREQAAIAAAEAEKLKTQGAVTPESLLAMSRDERTVKQGKDVFLATCASCHGPNGGGLIGPNLTDDAWLHGGAPEKIYATIREGYLPKGMPAWGPQLGEERVRAVSAYVLTLKNTNVAGGKPPQGEKEP
jgi:cytochrome c oxidase cbb3-type subunit 3